MDHSRNEGIGRVLREIAAVLDEQSASPYRANAYRNAAGAVEHWREDVGDLLAREGTAGLHKIPGVGASLAATIRDVVRLGHSPVLDRLRGTLDPEHLFRTIPVIGPELAHRIHEELHVESLEELEAAAWDGRLARVPGVGPRRLSAIKTGLDAALARVRAKAPDAHDYEPSVDMLLEVDREYRAAATRGELPMIAPRRMNPGGEATLPVLHVTHGDWHFTALYSNTPRAHALNKTRDWVVLYYHRDDRPERQCTVVTETHGPLAGRRVVRGRERAPSVARGGVSSDVFAPRSEAH